MKIPLTILSAIETALNAWLKLDGESLKKCEPLEGKIIRLHITGLDLNLFFLPAVSGMQVMGNYPDSGINSDSDSNTTHTDSNYDVEDNSNSGVVDATIHGSPMALIRLSTSENSGASMLESDVEIDGDMRVAETFSAILREVDIDWEELLSKLVGDIIAHQSGQVVRTGTQWFTESVEAMRLNTGEYLSEESKVTPAEAEIHHYMDQVDELRMDADRLEARVHLIKNQMENVSDTNKDDIETGIQRSKNN